MRVLGGEEGNREKSELVANPDNEEDKSRNEQKQV